jgi:hypothetical protein
MRVDPPSEVLFTATDPWGASRSTNFSIEVFKLFSKSGDGCGSETA